MTQRVPLVAIVPVDKDPRKISDIKRLLLFFDEIHFVLPAHPILRPHAVEELMNRTKADLPPIGLSYFDDVEYGVYLSVQSLPAATIDALQTLQGIGIAKEFPPDEFYGLTTSREYIALRAALLEGETTDAEFNDITGTEGDAYQRIQISNIHSVSLDGSKEKVLHSPVLPSGIKASDFVTAMLCNAQLTSGFPIFLNSIDQRVLDYRFRRFAEGLNDIREKWGSVLPDDFKTTFGQVSYSLANGVFSSALIEKKSISDILSYRSAMDSFREKFISSNLTEIATMVEGSPWSAKTRGEIQRYIFQKLNSDLVEFNRRSVVTWEQMFGKMTVHFAEVTKSTLIGGSAGGLLGSILPLAGSWQLLLAGAVLGLGKQIPGMTKDIVDAFIESRKQARNPIAYIAKFR